MDKTEFSSTAKNRTDSVPLERNIYRRRRNISSSSLFCDNVQTGGELLLRLAAAARDLDLTGQAKHRSPQNWCMNFKMVNKCLNDFFVNFKW